MELVVTQGGKPMTDQRLGVRLFKDAAGEGERYRIVKAKIGWLAYYRGRRITDTREMQLGASGPGVLIDQIKRIRRW